MRKQIGIAGLAICVMSMSSAMAQSIVLESCKPENEFFRCNMDDGRPVFLKPDEYQMIAMAMASGGEVEMKVISPSNSVPAASSAPKIAQKPVVPPVAPTPAEPVKAQKSLRDFFTQEELDEASEEVISKDSKSWLTWRYDIGSARNSKITVTSEDNRTMVVASEYTFNGGERGTVQYKTTEGKIDCIQFWNEPTCRPLGQPPSHGLLGAALGSFFGSGSGGNQSRNCQLERIGGQVQEVCY